MTSDDVFKAIFVVVFVVSTIYAFVHKMTEVGLTGVLESWRAHPRKAVLVGFEFVALMLVAWAFAVSTRWVAVAWYIAGILVASVMLNSIGRKSGRPLPTDPTQPPAEIKYRRPWPPQQAGSPAPPETSQTAEPESLGGDAQTITPATPASSGSPEVTETQSQGETSYQAVMEWRTPVPEDYEKRVLIREHAVAYRSGAPQPLALCGYQYDPLDLPAAKVFAPWGLGVERAMRCPACTKALRDAGYTLWNLDPWALGR